MFAFEIAVKPHRASAFGDDVDCGMAKFDLPVETASDSRAAKNQRCKRAFIGESNPKIEA